MLNLFLTFLTSLLLGMRHATDPDHIIAVSTIVSRERSVGKAAGIGAVWGLGHTLTIFLVGGAIILFQLAFTPRMGLSMEFTVAVTRVVLGALNLWRIGPAARPIPSLPPFIVGVVHGLAGSAAATLLILPLIREARWAVAYLLVFGLGTVAGMTMVTFAIAAPSVYAAERLGAVQRGVRAVSGVVSLTFGLYLAWKIGFVDGLFTSHPTWTPG